MKSEIEKIVRLLNRTYHAGAWHGPSVKEALQNIDEETARKRIPNTHSIIELVAHMTAWRKFVIAKLDGQLEYNVPDEKNFPNPENWAQALQELDETQEKLISMMDTLPDSKLSELVPHNTYKYTHYTMLHGIIQHDLYHTGQIMLIRKSVASR